MSFKPLVELRCDGPTCSNPTKGVYEMPAPDGRTRPKIPDTWYTVHSAPADDAHFCSLACLAKWAAKAIGATLTQYRITQNGSSFGLPQGGTYTHPQ